MSSSSDSLSDTDYTTSPLWADIHPIPQDDGPTPLAQIAYRPEYSTAMSYLRAVMAKNEYSERVLLLTSDVIRMNPAHYTVWSYRFQCLVGLSQQEEQVETDGEKDEAEVEEKMGGLDLGGMHEEKERREDQRSESIRSDVRENQSQSQSKYKQQKQQKPNHWLIELAYTTQIALIYEKNYQIWHHRQLIVDHLSLSSPTNPNGISLANERAVTMSMFDKDSKNYHVWTYRQWLVGRFGLFEDNGGEEERFTREMIEKDVRNNSAWNHRYFVMFGGREKGKDTEADVNSRVEKEVKFAGEMVEKAPQNASVWNYLKGILTFANKPLSTIKSLCESFAPIDSPDFITSSHALDILSQIHAEAGNVDCAVKALNLLSTTFDPIRKNYWSYRQRMMEMKMGKMGGSTGAGHSHDGSAVAASA